MLRAATSHGLQQAAKLDSFVSKCSVIVRILDNQSGSDKYKQLC